MKAYTAAVMLALTGAVSAQQCYLATAAPPTAATNGFTSISTVRTPNFAFATAYDVTGTPNDNSPGNTNNTFTAAHVHQGTVPANQNNPNGTPVVTLCDGTSCAPLNGRVGNDNPVTIDAAVATGTTPTMAEVATSIDTAANQDSANPTGHYIAYHTEIDAAGAAIGNLVYLAQCNTPTDGAMSVAAPLAAVGLAALAAF